MFGGRSIMRENILIHWYRGFSKCLVLEIVGLWIFSFRIELTTFILLLSNYLYYSVQTSSILCFHFNLILICSMLLLFEKVTKPAFIWIGISFLPIWFYVWPFNWLHMSFVVVCLKTNEGVSIKDCIMIPSIPIPAFS